MAQRSHRLDRERANRVFGSILAAYRTRAFPFNRTSTIVPHTGDFLPPTLTPGSLEHARLLFYFCSYMKGGIESSTAILALGRLYGREPALFEPRFARALDPDGLTATLRAFGLGFRSAEVSAHWIENSARLQDRFGGDPRRILEGVRSFDGACERILNPRTGSPTGFLGFHYKMVSMLCYFFMDGGLAPHFPIPPPVDIHWLRILVEHEILRLLDPAETDFYKPEILADIRAFLTAYCAETPVDPLEFCDAVWLFGRALCADNPGNWSHQTGPYQARRTLIEAAPLVWDRRQVRAWQRSCARCPVSSTCAWNVPSMPYYIHGVLRTRGRRTDPPGVDRILSLFPEP